MRKIIVCGIDGTGSKVWGRNPDLLNSHVNRFLLDIDTDDSNKHYEAGPSTLGTEVQSIVDNSTSWVFDTLVRLVQQGTPQDEIDICLVGHSRGCIAAIQIANNLVNYLPVAFLPPSIPVKCPIKIRFLGLYDTVNRALRFPDVDVPNVAMISHAVRQNRSFFGGSRSTFGTVDVPRATRQEFDTAHGGIGGDPGFFDEPTISSDDYCNALTVVLTNDELVRRFGFISPPRGAFRGDFGQPRVIPKYTQLKGKPREDRVDQLTTYWQECWAADLFIRQGAIASKLTFAQTSGHTPFLEKDRALADRLAREMGIRSLSHEKS